MTLDPLYKIGQPPANRCYPYKLKEESIDDLLFHCSKVRIIWSLWFSLFSVNWAIPSSMKDTILSWHSFL